MVLFHIISATAQNRLYDTNLVNCKGYVLKWGIITYNISDNFVTL